MRVIFFLLIQQDSTHLILCLKHGCLTKPRQYCYIASTHFGIENYLNVYNRAFYNSFSRTNYNAPVSYNLKDAVSSLIGNGSYFTATLHAEESVLHGDPALKINSFPKPDFDIEAQNVIINPTFVSVADNSFKVKCYFIIWVKPPAILFQF